MTAIPKLRSLALVLFFFPCAIGAPAEANINMFIPEPGTGLLCGLGLALLGVKRRRVRR